MALDLGLLCREGKVVRKHKGRGRNDTTEYVHVWNITTSLEVAPADKDFLYTSFFNDLMPLPSTFTSSVWTLAQCTWCDSECMHAYSCKRAHVHDPYHSVLGRPGAWPPGRSGCTSPGKSRPVRGIGRRWACLYTGEQSETRQENESRRGKENWPTFTDVLSQQCKSSRYGGFSLIEKHQGGNLVTPQTEHIYTSLRCTSNIWKHI